MFRRQMSDEKKSKKPKRPTALKRRIQDDKRQMQNKSFKSKVKTAMKRLESASKAGNKESLPKELNECFSLIDKSVNKGIYKQNKANREKAKATKLAQI